MKLERTHIVCGNIQSPQKIDDRGKNLSKRSSQKDVVKKGRKYAVPKSTGLWLENCPMTNLTQEMWLEIRRSLFHNIPIDV